MKNQLLYNENFCLQSKMKMDILVENLLYLMVTLTQPLKNLKLL